MTNFQQRSVLIVDDEADIRELLSEHVRAMGFNVLTAEDGVKALEATQQHEISAIVCDIEMPNMNGLKFLETVRARDIDIPFIILTGLADKERVLTALRLGALDFVSKPFRSDELRSVIQRAVEIGIRRNRLHSHYANGDLNSVAREKKMIKLLTLTNHKKRSAS